MSTRLHGTLTWQTVAMSRGTDAIGAVLGGWLMARVKLAGPVFARRRARRERREAAAAGARRTRGPLLAAALLTAPAALAQPANLPSLFDVAGVSPDDVLNVRGGPDTSEPIIGRLAADTRDIEVVALDPSGVWGLVNTGERAGWVALRFLREQPGTWTAGSLPAGLVCLGTEPFWSLRPDGDALVYETPEAGPTRFPFTALDTSAPDDVRRALVAGDGGPTATITPRVCSDGMSDRAFGLEALLILTGEQGPQLRSGCCSIAPRTATAN